MATGTWEQDYQKRIISIGEAAKKVNSGDTVVTALGVGACSTEFYNAIVDRHAELQDVNIIDTVQVRPAKLYDPELIAGLAGRINYKPGFGLGTTRKMGSSKVSDFYPVTAMDLADKVAKRADIFIAMVTPPNKQGYVNLGLTNFYTMEAIREGRASGKLRLAIAEVNEQMPVIYGDNWMHISEFDYFVVNLTPIPSFGRGTPSELEKKIAGQVLELINDGDTFQMGIGGIPEAVISGLDGKKELGVFTEMFPIGLPQLVEKGIVTNARKPLHKGVTVATFCMGDQSMYDYARENPACAMYPASYTNNPAIIAQHPNFVALNMAVMVDYSGQIASEGMGHRQISGTGGQLDFMMGAYWSKGGRGVTTLTAARKLPDGSLSSSIVPELPPGTPVTVPRTYAQYVVTEYGIANLRYKTRRERAEELISISHPDLRGELRKSLQLVFYPKVSI